MKIFVRGKAKEKCSFDGPTIGDNLKISVKYVPLQINEYQENRDSDGTGHLHTRKEIINRSKNVISSIPPQYFFQRSLKYIRNTPDYKNAQTKQAKEKVLREKGNVVGIIGQAGVGKSTFMKHLLYRIVSQECLYNGDFVFYVKLGDFFNKTKINLFQFLMGNAAYDSLEWMKNLVIRKKVLKLLSQSQFVCILLDGFDEAGIDYNHLKQNQFDVDGQNSPELYILKLLKGEILPNAKKLITSRPGQILDLPASYKPKFIVKIFGFNQKDIEQICHDTCSVEHASSVLFHIKSQPDLLSYCLVPINGILTIHCIYRLLKEKVEISLPKNITDVFVMTFFFFSKTDHMRENLKEFDIKNLSDLKKISKLAWSGIINKKLYFDENDLKDLDINDTDISSFTVTLKQKNYINRVKIVENSTKKCIYFSHLLLQEFFATVYYLYFMKFTEFKAIFSDSNQSILNDKRFEMINKFMFGLSNPQTFETLKEIYPNISKPTQHIKVLKNRATRIVSTISVEESSDNLARVCCWAYESQDSKFCKKLASKIPNTLELYIDELLPSDVLSFCWVMKARKTNLDLNIYFEAASSDFKNFLDFFCKEIELILKDLSNIKVIVLMQFLYL